MSSHDFDPSRDDPDRAERIIETDRTFSEWMRPVVQNECRRRKGAFTKRDVRRFITRKNDRFRRFIQFRHEQFPDMGVGEVYGFRLRQLISQELTRRTTIQSKSIRAYLEHYKGGKHLWNSIAWVDVEAIQLKANWMLNYRDSQDAVAKELLALAQAMREAGVRYAWEVYPDLLQA